MGFKVARVIHRDRCSSLLVIVGNGVQDVLGAYNAKKAELDAMLFEQDGLR